MPPLSLAELARELVRLALVRAQIREIEQDRQHRLAAAPESAGHRMTAQLARLHGLGIETAELLATETVARPLRDRRAVARGACPRAGRKAGPVGRADRGARRERRAASRERAGQACPWQRTGGRQCPGPPCHDPAGLALPQIPAAQRAGAIACPGAGRGYRARTRDGRGDLRKTMIVALARKLLIALWRLVTTGELPEGVILRPSAAPATN